jgi:hypothetical protein
MLRNFLVVLSLLVWQLNHAQLKLPVDSTTGKVSYTEIVYVDSAAKSKLFSSSLEWIALSFKSAKSVIELKDEPAGKIIVKGALDERIPGSFANLNIDVRFTMNITCKDGRCRIQLTGWNYQYCLGGGNCTDETFEYRVKEITNGCAGKKAWIEFLQNCDTKAHSMLDSYSGFLQKPASKEEDW